MKKILITGAGGYIGSIATQLFLKNGYNVVAVDNFVTGFKAPLEQLQKEYGEEQFRFYNYDLGSETLDELFQKEVGIEAVVNYAASCTVDESMKNPGKYFRNNTCGALNLITVMLKNNVKKIIFSSTCATYGEAQYVPIDEKHPTNPANPYGASKRMTEQMLEWYSSLGMLDYVILRYFNVCGASDDGSIGDSKTPSPHLMQNAIRGGLGIEPFFLTCGTFDTPDGSPIRDFVNVVDLNEAHLAALDYILKGGKSEIFNIGTGTGNSVIEIVEMVKKQTGAEFKLERTTARQGENSKLVASIEKAKEILKWQPKRSLEDSVKSLLAWYKLHPHGWNQ